MFILMDIEWVQKKNGHVSPTQIAAIKVDTSWNEVDRFYARIRPQDSTYYDWQHVAYTGGQPGDFLMAHGLYTVLDRLKKWIASDDVLCWWFDESPAVFKKANKLIFKQTTGNRNLILAGLVRRFQGKEPGHRTNQYRMSQELGIPTPSMPHYAMDDAEAMRNVLHAIQIPQSYFFTAPTPQPQKKTNARAKNIQYPYLYDTESGLFHKHDCDAVRESASVIGYEGVKTALKKGYTPCPQCMEDEFRAAKRARIKKAINNSYFNFIYTPDSEVFHWRDCGLILSAKEIRGSTYYAGCADTGRRPCRICHPAPDDPTRHLKMPPGIKNLKKDGFEQQPPAKELEAYKRYKQALTDREKGMSEDMTDLERTDLLTLTQTTYGFWAGAGYQNFHLRNCTRLKGLSNLRGFSHFSDAVRAGYTPCKHCRPTKKNDVAYSIPITNRKRSGESVSDLEELCSQYGFEYSNDKKHFEIVTSVGRWRIHTKTMPITLEHINLTMTPDNTELYHRQPRLFLSLVDVFKYIQRHDECLQKKGPPPIRLMA